MSYEVNDYEYDSVTSLSGPERYQYLVNKIVDWEEVWSIKDQSGWSLMGDDTDNELVPIWPAEKYASACCTGLWKNCEPETIDLETWLEKWISGMSADGRSCAVFPLPSDKGLVVTPEQLEKDIREALLQYE